MSSIEKMRAVADMLFSQERYNEAFTIYDELYRQIWTVLGTAQSINSINNISLLNFVNRKRIIEQEQRLEASVNSICIKSYNIPIKLFINEFIKILYRHIQCICFSIELYKGLIIENVLTEFLVLYKLITQPEEQRKISAIFTIASGVVDNNRIKRIRANLSKSDIENLLVDIVEKNNNGEWVTINNLLLQYLNSVYNKNHPFLNKINAIVNKNYFHFNNTANKKYNTYSSYEKYERYERYERYDNGGFSNNYEFNASTATETEKTAYYGQLIGLKGKVTKNQIRIKYLALITKYHPDKVQHLGSEIRELAERKTKELNIAYNWLKNRYNI